MISQVLNILNTCPGMGKESRILVGVSGGPDSMCLLDILVRSGFQPFVAHLDHGLRSSSRANAEFVRSQCEHHGLEFIGERKDVREHALKFGLTLEAAARSVRYHFLFSAAERKACDAVLVAHNADDQVETILFHLIRGSSTAGLRGMQACSLPNAWSSRIPLVRPLLRIRRENIMTYIKDEQVPYIIDESNRDERFTRNRIRHSLLPILESFNPNVRTALQRMGVLVAGDYEIIQSVVGKVWDKVVVRSGEGYVGLKGAELRRVSRPLQRHIFYRAVAQILPDTSAIDYALIERACEFISSPPDSARMDLAAGMRIIQEADLILLSAQNAELPTDDWPQIAGDEAHELPLPGEILLPGGWVLTGQHVEVDQARSQAEKNTDGYTAWLDLDCLTVPLRVRTRRKGDRINPFGMDGAGMKVSDYMINEKIPRRARDGWPIMYSEDRIAWICGYTIGDGFQITSRTRRAVRFTLRRTV